MDAGDVSRAGGARTSRDDAPRPDADGHGLPDVTRLGGEHVHVADDASGGAPLASTLGRLAERLAVALECSECCFYEYLPERDAVLPKAIWALDLSDDDRAWVGVENQLHRQRHIAPVFEKRQIVVTQAEDEESDPSARESMAYWGEKTALYAPLLHDGELLGVVELVEHRRRREFGDDDVRLVSALADVAALAIANARTWRDEELKNRRLSALLKSSGSLSSTMILDEVLQRLAEHAAKAINAASAYIYEYDPVGEAVVWRCEYQADAAFVSSDEVGDVYPLDFFPADRRVIRHREVVETGLDDPSLDERSRALMMEWRHTTYLSVPLVHGNDVVGLMELAETAGTRHYTDQEIELAVAIGEQAAVAIRNAQLYRRESWRNERLVHVLEISRTVGATLDPDEIVDVVCERLGAVFGDRPTKTRVDLRKDEGDTAGGGGGPRDDAVSEGRRLAVPLLAKSRSDGELVVTSPVARPFDRDEIELVQIIANQLAVAIENARLYDRLEEQAITDGLTGLYNHRFFYDRLIAEVARARRYGLQLSLLMLDIDDFKRFNDTFGHQAGDRVLVEIGRIMREQLRRDVDIPCRYGGEEFAVILPHTPASGAEIVGRRLTEQVTAIVGADAEGDSAWLTGERLRVTIATASFPGRETGETTHVTVSIGVSTYPDQADEAETLVANADAALYRAKREGKNRVEIYE
jgi:GGDEF domain-containing protein/transcriptional regulator with GAF, ATPase, and Fis domain